MQGRVALVTGSTSGIGLSVAKVLASRLCHVIVTGLGSEETINKCTSDIKRAGKNQISVDFLGADLEYPEKMESLCKEAEKIHPKGVDILVNNAGIQYVSPVEDYSLEKWNQMMNIHLNSSFALIKYLLPGMKRKDWGRIINIASVHGMVASVNKAGYVAAKHGLIGLTKTVALETAKTGVTCNAICPGWVSTELARKQMEALAERENISTEQAQALVLNSKMPSGKMSSPKEIGELVAYLCSPSSENIRGAAINIDGAWLAQ